MKNLTVLIFATIGLVLTGCLPQDEKGTTSVSTEGTAGTTDPVFVIQPLPPGTPGAPDQPVPPPVTPPATPGAATITINNGALYTSANTMSVRITYSGEVSQMKISQNENCQGGIWGQDPFETAITKTLNIPVAQQNARAYVSVQFRDYDFGVSPCYKQSIVHDTKGPDILFQKYPVSNLQEGSTTQLIYNVTDAGSGVDTVQCRLNALTQPCIAMATVNVPAMAPGTYTFEITAKDKLGYTSQSSVTWQVTATSKTITHNINVAEYRKWDILFVIDNSGSMEYEQTNMAIRTQNFLSVLQGLDWQIAVTTTDVRTNQNLADGRFVPLTGMPGQYLLNSSMSTSQAQTVLSNTLQRPETGSGLEQGIAATYRTIQRAMTGQQPAHTAFFRDGANFAVVLISDEDESANGVMNDPQSLANLIQTSFNGQKNFLFNSIITVPNDSACLTTYGYSYGERYKTISELTGGIMGSVCAADYASQVTGIADKIRNMAKTFTLSCQPLPGYPITITRGGVAVTAPFTMSGLQLSFATAIDPGDYQLVYHCAQ